jgi:hypothetical protein
MELAILVVQGIAIGVPLALVLLVVRMFRAARAFDRHFQETYPREAEEARSHWPAYVSMFDLWALCYFSLFESDMVKDEKLRALRRRAITSFVAIAFLIVSLTVLLSFIGVFVRR